MGIGKLFLFGFGGLSLLGAVVSPFIEMNITPEDRLAAGKSFLVSQCAQVTRNRYINGRLGRGPAYCECLVANVEDELKTGDEFRYVAKLHSGVGKERTFFQEARITASVTSVRKEFIPKIGSARVAEINQSFFPTVRSCTRSM